ncbi:hypothetical protein Ahy_B07g088387 [Arachis hypogaea]|uniref:SWIM-type domain-containing protein n=1 Tax=Arachis hypogaea TaxID=3818 RepID=A0A444YED9_ARAHY|nr:hypothetical protein Ahy_B07g088387 [Arachis hypogaea]
MSDGGPIGVRRACVKLAVPPVKKDAEDLSPSRSLRLGLSFGVGRMKDYGMGVVVVVTHAYKAGLREYGLKFELTVERAHIPREGRRSVWEMASCSRVVHEMGCGNGDDSDPDGEMATRAGDDEEKMLDIGVEEDEFEGLIYKQSEGTTNTISNAGRVTAADVLKMEFNSPAEATIFYEEYSRAKGFAMRQGKKLKNRNGDFVRYTYLCNRQGFRDKKWLEKVDRKREHKVVTRCGCPVEMRIKPKGDSGRWFVSFFVEEHNHELLPMKYVDYLPAHRKISDVDIAHMKSMRQVGISIPKIYESIAAQAGGFNLVPFTKRDMYNEIRRQRAMQNGDVNAALRFVTNFQRCVDFLRDNEEELDFRSSYGTPVLQTQFPELEKSGAINFTREIFSRYRESLKRCVRITILECIERDDRCVYVTQKYRRPNSRWDVVHMKGKEEFLCSCLRMESFGLPCVHILAVLVRLDIDSLPKSLVLARWSKAAKEDLCYEPLSSRYGDAGVLYRSRVGAFLQHCKRLAKVACIREEDFRQYLAKVVEDTCWLEKKNGLGGAVAGNGAGNSGGGVRDPISVKTKGTGRGNEPLGCRGIKRRKCSTCGCVGHRRTRCPNAPPTSAPSTQGEGANMLSQTVNVVGRRENCVDDPCSGFDVLIGGYSQVLIQRGLLMVQVCVIGHADVLGWISNVLDILESCFKGTVSAQGHDLHHLQESVFLPEISGAASHPKVTEVLLERNSPDTALMVFRWAGGDVRARIECGLLTEAFMHQRNLCTRVKEKSFNNGSPLQTADVPKGLFSYWVEVLVTEICCLCIRRNLVDRMLELP